jgi:uncharacterized OB-fold protein
MNHADGYDKYMKSAWWRNIRKDMLKLAGSRCHDCGRHGAAGKKTGGQDVAGNHH